MEDNAPGYSNDDLPALYTFTGGIPEYLFIATIFAVVLHYARKAFHTPSLGIISSCCSG